MRHVWLSGLRRLEVLKPQVDDGGYDLVLEAANVARHIQLEAMRLALDKPRRSSSQTFDSMRPFTPSLRQAISSISPPPSTSKKRNNKPRPTYYECKRQQPRKYKQNEVTASPIKQHCPPCSQSAQNRKEPEANAQSPWPHDFGIILPSKRSRCFSHRLLPCTSTT